MCIWYLSYYPCTLRDWVVSCIQHGFHLNSSKTEMKKSRDYRESWDNSFVQLQQHNSLKMVEQKLLKFFKCIALSLVCIVRIKECPITIDVISTFRVFNEAHDPLYLVKGKRVYSVHLLKKTITKMHQTY